MRETRWGVFFGVAAYLWWGLSPIYFHALVGVPSLVILSHRVVWSVVLLAGIVSVRREWGEVKRLIAHRRTALLLLGSTVCMGVNWLLFIYLITTGRTLQASLGYFINPLISAAVGVIVLRERLRVGQWIAMAIALAGVGVYAVGRGGVPGMGLLLAGTFAMYALCRKLSGTGAVPGLMVETVALLPAAIAYLAIWGKGEMWTAKGWLLLLAGVMTTVPLLFFAGAVRRLPMTLLGLLQYVAPTFQFLCGWALFGEVMRLGQVIGFGIIWTALGIYSGEAWGIGRTRKQEPMSLAPE